MMERVDQGNNWSKAPCGCLYYYGVRVLNEPWRYQCPDHLDEEMQLDLKALDRIRNALTSWYLDLVFKYKLGPDTFAIANTKWDLPAWARND